MNKKNHFIVYKNYDNFYMFFFKKNVVQLLLLLALTNHKILNFISLDFVNDIQLLHFFNNI